VSKLTRIEKLRFRSVSKLKNQLAFEKIVQDHHVLGNKVFLNLKKIGIPVP